MSFNQNIPGFFYVMGLSSLLANGKLHSLITSVTSGLLPPGYLFLSAKIQPFKADCPQHTGKIMPWELAKSTKSSCLPSFHW